MEFRGVLELWPNPVIMTQITNTYMSRMIRLVHGPSFKRIGPVDQKLCKFLWRRTIWAQDRVLIICTQYLKVWVRYSVLPEPPKPRNIKDPRRIIIRWHVPVTKRSYQYRMTDGKFHNQNCEWWYIMTHIMTLTVTQCGDISRTTISTMNTTFIS